MNNTKNNTMVESKNGVLTLLNTSILTLPGCYNLSDITLEEAKQLVKEAEQINSAIGHQTTAEIMSTLLEIDIEVNRQVYLQEVGQKALVFRLKGRNDKGKNLTVDDIVNIGYGFQLLERLQ